jgi:hypothetical protein
MNSLLTYGGLIMEDIKNKLICFGSSGVDVFRSVHNGLKTQFRKSATPFIFLSSKLCIKQT